MKTAMMKHKTAGGGVALALALNLAAWAEPSTEKVPYLGVGVAKVDDGLREQLKLRRGTGLQVREVVADSPAEKAGLKKHDVLEKLDDQLLFTGDQFTELVRGYKVGDKVALSLIRQGSPQRIEVTLGEREISKTDLARAIETITAFPGETICRELVIPKIDIDWGEDKSGPVTYLGVALTDLTPPLARQLELDEDEGAVVSHVAEDSPAEKAGLKEHDVIVKLDQKAVEGSEDLAKRIRKHSKGDKVKFDVIRAGKAQTLDAVLSEKKGPGKNDIRTVLERMKLLPRTITIKDKDPKSTARKTVVLQSRGEVVKGAGAPGETGCACGLGIKQKPPSAKCAVMVVKTDKQTVTIKEEDGKRWVKVEGADDKVLFDGPASTEEQKEKLPPDVRKQLDKIEKNIQLKEPAAGKLEDCDIEELNIETAEEHRDTI